MPQPPGRLNVAAVTVLRDHRKVTRPARLACPKKTSGGRSAHRSYEVFALANYFAMQVSAVSGVQTSRPV